MQLLIDALWFIGQSVYFFIPAAIANIAPVLVKFLPIHRPIYSKYLGPNKTWRGLIAGSIFAGFVVWAQRDLQVFWFFDELSLIEYQSESIIWLAILYGVGALGGDAFKSLIKRSLDKPPGSKWQPWDQIDFIIGTGICLIPVYWIGFDKLALAVLMAMVIHPIVNKIGFALKLKDVPH